MKGISSATAVLLHCWPIWRSFVRQQFLWIRIWRILNYLIVPRRIASSSPYSVGRGLAHNSTNLHCSPSSRLPPSPPPLRRYPFYMLISWIPPVKRNWYSPFPGTYYSLYPIHASAETGQQFMQFSHSVCQHQSPNSSGPIEMYVARENNRHCHHFIRPCYPERNHHGPIQRPRLN